VYIYFEHFHDWLRHEKKSEEQGGDTVVAET
jgi:hypothetical protein